MPGTHLPCHPFRPADAGTAGRQRSAGHAAAALDEQHVAPPVAVPGHPLAPADHPEAEALVQGQARGVLGEDRGLDRPDPGLLVEARRASSSARPTPVPRTSGSTYTECSTTPA